MIFDNQNALGTDGRALGGDLLANGDLRHLMGQADRRHVLGASRGGGAP
ncbi:MAG: hypothetical protein R2704_13465 [Microthrixaceae bacterium]